MTATAVLSPRDVPTHLNYYSSRGNGAPYLYAYEPPAGEEPNNLGQDTQPVIIHDARGKEEEYGLSLDTSGFQFVKHTSVEKDFTDKAKIQEIYYKEVEELLKKQTGAKRVFIFDHTIRRRPDSDKIIEGEPVRGPVESVHIDQTFDASIGRVHRHLGADAERLLKSRVRLINVWRPIGNPVAHFPLAVSDWRTLDTEHDLVVVRLIYPDREGNTFGVKYNPNHRWYYLSDQTPEEVTLIKCYDSEVDRARLTPHTAFLDSTSPKDAPYRESIELRALVFDSE
ncbi:hypothetical protein PHLCEN_2v4337 [Hermanssonia centrifuga]|uniref:Methyltransferase n=1 Tax=Hermanssonia centrifuga TaxID=98765 RepID=A0A2R6PVH2_9APHY|nr:hypothetical protein PHLCEN_2v4337 [Hermanssonia centrifuga]